MPGHRIIQTIESKPGYRCAFADADAADGLRLLPLACWAVVDGIPGSAGPEVCPMLDLAQGGLPSLTPLAAGLPGVPPGFLGTVGPDDDLGPWRERAARWVSNQG